MIIQKNEVLLLKSQSDDDKFYTTLIKNGFTVKYLEILEFVFINLPMLTEKLSKPDQFSGLIFTSPRAVTATKMSINEQLGQEWNAKQNFVVGETTFNLVRKELGLICEGKDSGNANNLANVIVSGSFTKPFLFPCGNLKRETLQLRLKEHNIEVEAVTVYETKENRNLKNDFVKLTSDFSNMSEYVVFFSPSGVNFTAELFQKFPLDDMKFIAIGPSTEKALRDENLPVFSVATKPTDSEVLNAINTKTL